MGGFAIGNGWARVIGAVESVSSRRGHVLGV